MKEFKSEEDVREWLESISVRYSGYARLLWGNGKLFASLEELALAPVDELHTVGIPVIHARLILEKAKSAGVPTLQQLQQDLQLAFNDLPQGELTSDTYTSVVRALEAIGHTTQYLRIAQPLPLQADSTVRLTQSTAAAGSSWPKTSVRFRWPTADVMAYVRPLLAVSTPASDLELPQPIVNNENVTSFLVNDHAFVPANKGLAGLRSPVQWRAFELTLTAGRLDGHAMRVEQGASSEDSVIAVVEFKGVDTAAMEECGLGSRPFDIIDAMSSDHYKTDFDCKARRIVGQLVGYMCTAKVRVGVHSCYQSFQFVIYIREQQHLFVSPVYSYNAQDPSIIQLLMYAAHLAEQTDSAFVPPQPVGQPVTDDKAEECGRQHASFKRQDSGKGDGSNPYAKPYTPRKREARSTDGGGGGSSCSGALGDNTDDLYMYSQLVFERHVLGTGITGVVWAGRLDGHRVAVKTVTCKDPEVRESLHHEAHVYMALSDLQGCYLPRLEATGYRGSSGSTFCLVLELLTGQDPQALSASERACLWPSALQALHAMHDKGWLHGDLRSENIMCDVKARQVKLLDLGRSWRVSAEEDCRREVARLAAIFGMQ